MNSTNVEGKPIKGLDISTVGDVNEPISPIPRKKKSGQQSNGSNGHLDSSKTSISNGDGYVEKSTPLTKRYASEAFIDDNSASKKMKIQQTGRSDGPIELDEAEDGSIFID